MLIRSYYEIKAVDILTHDATVVVRGLPNSDGLVFDIRDRKLYFGDGDHMSKANLDGSDKEVIFKNARILRMAIDWKGRRIFWTRNSPTDQFIFVMNLNGKYARPFVKTGWTAISVAVDPLAG